MSRTVTISDDLAALLEERRKQGGYPSLDAAAEALIVNAMAVNDVADNRTDEELCALIDEAEASGPEVTWDAVAAKAEVIRRYIERGRQP